MKCVIIRRGVCSSGRDVRNFAQQSVNAESIREPAYCKKPCCFCAMLCYLTTMHAKGSACIYHMQNPSRNTVSSVSDKLSMLSSHSNKQQGLVIEQDCSPVPWSDKSLADLCTSSFFFPTQCPSSHLHTPSLLK